MDSNQIAMLKEYEFLKSELQKKMDAHHSLVMFAITTTITIFALEIIVSTPYIALLPFCVLIPVSMRINCMRNSIAKISAYLIVHIESKIEGLKWETKNNHLFLQNNSSYLCVPNSPSNMKNWECFILGIISCAIYLMSVCQHSDEQLIDHLITNWWLVIPLIILFALTIAPATPDRQRARWIDYWGLSKAGHQLDQLAANRLDAVLILYIGQVCAFVLYALLGYLLTTVLGLPDTLASNIQNMAYLAMLYFVIKTNRHKIKCAYGATATEAILSLHLLGISVTFVICGCWGDANCTDLAGMAMGLFLGNLFSLKDLIGSDSIGSIWRKNVKDYASSGISKDVWWIVLFAVLATIVNVFAIHYLQ